MMNKAIAIATIALTATAGAATAQAAGSHTAYDDWSECSIEVPAGADYRDGLWFSAEGKVIAAAEFEDECVDFLGPQSSADEIMVVTLRWLASSVG